MELNIRGDDMTEDTFDRMRKFQEEMNRRFNRFMESFDTSGELFRQPLIDLKETEKDLIAEIELPGVKKGDIQLDVTEDSLDIKVEHSEEQREERDDYLKTERSFRGFERSMTLPYNIDPDNTKAEYKNGVLSILMPKTEKRKTRNVDIE